MADQIDADNELRNSLQEKKAMLQHYRGFTRTRCQDITSHQTMIDSVSDKGAALASQQVKAKLKQLNTKYRTLCADAQAQVKTSEEHVDQHQAYQDCIQQCRDWMASTKDKLAVCAEVSGDRQTLQNRLDRVQDLLSSLRDGEKKVKNAHTQGEKTLPQTASHGQANIKTELESLAQDWEALANRLNDVQQNLMHALQALQAYDGSCDSLNKWLRDVELKIKDLDLKSTLRDKQEQVDKFKALQEEVLSKQNQFDDLANMASQVQGSDTRLEAINKLQDRCGEHEAYQENFTDCSNWINTLQRRLQVCANMAGDKDDVEDRLIKLQELIAEKEQGTNKIHFTVESGEKLYPSTASEGRDLIRQELRTLRDQWEQLCDQLSDTQRKLDSCLVQWSSYDENFEQFQKWLLDTEIQLKEDTDLKSTLPDKKAQLQGHRVLHQDIQSRQHVMENLAEKAQTLAHSSPAAKVNKFVDQLHKKYEKLCTTSKDTLDKFEHNVKDHQQYQDMYQDCQDWLNSSREKVEACSDTSGDKLSLQNKLERLKEYAQKVGDGEKKLKLTKDLCEKTARNSSQGGREVLKREIDHLQSEWEDYLARIQQAEEDLETALLQWGDFETKFESCAAWLKDMEQQVKNYELKSTLKDKLAQVEKFRLYTRKKQREEILSHQPEIDRFTDDAQNLMHTSADVRLSTQVSQLTNRYRGLLSLVKDHQAYENRLAEFKSWMVQADEKLEGCQQPAADQDTMEERRVMIQMLFSEKDHGLQRLNAAVESGEKLYPDTAANGREKVRQDLRAAKDDWDRLFSSLNDAQRRVDSFLMQWTSYADGQDQLMRWLSDTEATLRSDVDLKNTLQEKRLQLQNFRSLLQDILSHQRLVDSVVEKAQGVLQSTSNPEVASFIKDINSRYENLAQFAKSQIQQCEQNVHDHHQYQEASQAAIDWLTLMKDRLTMCADTSGDRHTLQNKLERVQELVVALPDGETKVKACDSCATRSMETTALKGRQGMQQELDILKVDWDNHMTQVKALKHSIEHAVEQWARYEEQFETLSVWVKDMEKKVKDFPLKATLEEKQQQYLRYQILARTDLIF
ncbi:hypothetical protein KUTeg_014079 [Tegillarca granosa]|uniref:SYNE1 n=1 Tax=Tegillarca granosa TaxID=220873 RepID=A0ABQ9EZD7_TEGGR|nr:hypothetical protein KUTeg_014079 [Tegillarca granosa]